MSAQPVDVLAVMALAASWLPCDQDSEGEQIETRFAQARAAVAELIAAVSDGNTAKADHDGTPIAIYLPAQTVRLRAALAAVMGETK